MRAPAYIGRHGSTTPSGWVWARILLSSSNGPFLFCSVHFLPTNRRRALLLFRLDANYPTAGRDCCCRGFRHFLSFEAGCVHNKRTGTHTNLSLALLSVGRHRDDEPLFRRGGLPDHRFIDVRRKRITQNCEGSSIPSGYLCLCASLFGNVACPTHQREGCIWHRLHTTYKALLATHKAPGSTQPALCKKGCPFVTTRTGASWG